MMIDYNPDHFDQKKEFAMMRFSFGTIMCVVCFIVVSVVLSQLIVQQAVETRRLREAIERLEDPHVQDFLNKYYYRQEQEHDRK